MLLIRYFYLHHKIEVTPFEATLSYFIKYIIKETQTFYDLGFFML